MQHFPKCSNCFLNYSHTICILKLLSNINNYYNNYYNYPEDIIGVNIIIAIVVFTANFNFKMSESLKRNEQQGFFSPILNYF